MKIQQVTIEQRPDEDDDFVVFDTSLADNEGAHIVPRNSDSVCEIPTRTLSLFLAGLDYRMVSGKPNCSFLVEMPKEVRRRFQKLIGEGRMLSGAHLINAEMIRFYFGERDAAVSAYF